MAKSLNKVMIIGYTADEPTIRTFPSGGKVAHVTIVTNESVQNRDTGQWEEIPEWHRVTFWNKSADSIERYVNKGKRMYVEGRLKTSSYVDKTTGTKRYSTEIIANNFLFLDGGRRDDGQGGYNGGSQYGGGQYGSGQYGGGGYNNGGQYGAQGGYGQNRAQSANPYGNEWGQDQGGSMQPQVPASQGYDSFGGGQQAPAASPYGAPSQPAEPSYQPYNAGYGAAAAAGGAAAGAAPASPYGAPSGSPYDAPAASPYDAPSADGGVPPAAPAGAAPSAPGMETGGGEEDIPF